MTDRELLEAAARAAGIEVSWEAEALLYTRRVDVGFGLGSTAWNPLTDDGDAFRLIAKLKLDVSTLRKGWQIWPYNENWPLNEPYGTDPAASLRRAIVRAAASVGW